jgi:cytochrome P450
LNPEVQKRAQAEIDHVAPNRLPTFDDYDSLPYIRAILKESARWGPTTPLGLPHRVMEDDVYENYLIPGGSTVFLNIW